MSVLNFDTWKNKIYFQQDSFQSGIDLYKVSYGALPIGLKSYRDYVKSRYETVRDWVAQAIIGDVDDPDELMSFAFPSLDEEIVPSIAIQASELVKAASGEYAWVTVHTLDTSTRTIRVSSVEVMQSVSRAVRTLAGNYGLLDYISSASLSQKFSLTDLLSRMKALDIDFIFEDFPLVASIPEGTELLNLLQALVDDGEDREDPDTGIPLITKDQYDSGSVLGAAVASIVDDIKDFFKDIPNIVTHFKQAMAAIGLAIGKTMEYLINFLMPGVFTDYEYVSKAQERGVDIPFLSLTIPASTSIGDFLFSYNESNPYLLPNGKWQVGECFHAKGSWREGTQYYDSIIMQVDSWLEFRAIPESAWDMPISSLFDSDKCNYVFPTSGGFLCVIRDDDSVQINWYPGAHDSIIAYGQYAVVPEMEGENIVGMRIASSVPTVAGLTQSPGVQAGSNEEFVKYIYSYLSDRLVDSGDYIDPTKDAFAYENMFNTPDVHPFPFLDCSFSETDPGASALYDWVSSHWIKKNRPDLSSGNAWFVGLLFNAFFYLISFIPRNRDFLVSNVPMVLQFHGESKLSADSDDRTEIFDYQVVLNINDIDASFNSVDIDQGKVVNVYEGAFLPYYKNILPSMDIHVQNKDERVAEAKTAILRTLLAAAGIAATAGVIKIRNKLRAKRNLLESDSFDARARISQTDGDARMQAACDKVKIDKKLERVNTLLDVINVRDTTASIAKVITSVRVIASDPDIEEKSPLYDEEGKFLDSVIDATSADQTMIDSVYFVITGQSLTDQSQKEEETLESDLS